MKMASLFDGISAFPLAGSRYGIEPVWSSEIEKFPLSVSATRFPVMMQLGDVTRIHGDVAPPVNVITFGSPCQDLSVAGRRAGMLHESNGDSETTRSGLFMEAVRIISEMREENGNPQYAIWENVPGALSSQGGEDFRVVLETLAGVVERVSIPKPAKWKSAGCVMGDGWSIAWRIVDAQYWGVAQRRRRIILVCHFGGGNAPKILFESGSLPWNSQTGRAQGAHTANAPEGSPACAGFNGWKAADVQYGRTCPTIEASMPPNVVLPINDQATHENGHCNGLMVGADGDPMYTLTDRDRHAICLQGSMIGRKDENGPQGSGINEDVAFTLNTIDRHAVFSISPYKGTSEECCLTETDMSRTLDTTGGDPACHQGGLIIVDTPALFDSHPQDSRVTGPHDVCPTISVKFAKGTADVPLMVENHPADSRVKLDDSGTCQTLTTRMGTGGGNVPMVAFRMVAFGEYADDNCASAMKARDYKDATDLVTRRLSVRRLTPLECERLMGFPDGWTEVKGCSDSQKYRALGNSIVVPCLEAVMERLCCYGGC